MATLERPIIYAKTTTGTTANLSVEFDPNAIALKVRFAQDQSLLSAAATKTVTPQTNIEIQNLTDETGYFFQVQAVGDSTNFIDSLWSPAIFAATGEEDGEPDSTAARLRSIRKRIRLLREALECPDSLINVSVDGISENFVNRKDLLAELESLEMTESRLSGRSSRIRVIDLSKT